MDYRLISDKRRKNRELWTDYKNKLQKELEDYCEDLCGHSFGEWIDDSWISVLGDYQENYRRDCWNCDKRVYAKKEDLKLLEVPEESLELIETNRDRSNYVVRGLEGISNFKDSQLIVAKTGDRERVGVIFEIVGDSASLSFFR